MKTSGYSTIETQASILNGLPIIVKASRSWERQSWDYEGHDEVDIQAIYWLSGKPISKTVWDKAEKYDPGFCTLIEQIMEKMR